MLRLPMWTQLANWLVQDGEVPELAAGARLRHVAVRASCWSIDNDSSESEGVRELSPDTAHDDPPARYALTGIVEKADEPNSVLLRIGSIPFHAEPSTLRGVGDEGAVEAYSSAFRVPAVDSQVTVECTLEVMAAHEALDLLWGLRYPDIRREWMVDAIKVVHRAWVPTGRPREWSQGQIIRVDDVDRMHAWADERPDAHASYLLDLRPVD